MRREYKCTMNGGAVYMEEKGKCIKARRTFESHDTPLLSRWRENEMGGKVGKVSIDMDVEPNR